MATGCGCKEVIDFLILLIPTPLVFVLFCSSIPTFCSFFYVFRSLYIISGGFCTAVRAQSGLPQLYCRCGAA